MNYKFKPTKKHLWIGVIVFLVARYYLGFFAEFIPVSGEWGTRGSFNIGEKDIRICQNIIVVNHPRDPIVRMILIRLYDWSYPITPDQIQEAIERAKVEYKKRGGDPTGLQAKKYSRIFFKETDDTPRNWDGKDDPSMEGPEEFHWQDLIGQIEWEEGGKKECTLF